MSKRQPPNQQAEQAIDRSSTQRETPSPEGGFQLAPKTNCRLWQVMFVIWVLCWLCHYVLLHLYCVGVWVHTLKCAYHLFHADFRKIFKTRLFFLIFFFFCRHADQIVMTVSVYQKCLVISGVLNKERNCENYAVNYMRLTTSRLMGVHCLHFICVYLSRTYWNKKFRSYNYDIFLVIWKTPVVSNTGMMMRLFDDDIIIYIKKTKIIVFHWRLVICNSVYEYEMLNESMYYFTNCSIWENVFFFF